MEFTPARPRRASRLLASVLAAAVASAAPTGVVAQDAAQPAATTKKQADAVLIKIGYIRWDEPRVTLSLIDMPYPDDGYSGALLGIEDNNTTGKFTKQSFELVTKGVETAEAALAALDELAAAGISYVLLDLPTDVLLAVADAPAAKDRLLFNVSNKDERIREEDCRVNVVHIAPSYSMLADGLAQYLVWKKWSRWFLISGSLPQDKLWAEALKRAAGRFGAEIVEEREYTATDTARRTDTGHVQVQRQLPVFTQDAAEHDVVITADESEIFATYVPFRTWDAKPVAGSSGLKPSAWDPSHEQWGAYQMQNRFFDLNRRGMRERDINAWTAVRIVGEAATRAKSGEPSKIIEYINGPDLAIAAFKGQKLTIRNWNHQLRQPILLVDGRSTASVSPQEGFLHEKTELDTLGYDEPETKCSF